MAQNQFRPGLSPWPPPTEKHRPVFGFDPGEISDVPSNYHRPCRGRLVWGIHPTRQGKDQFPPRTSVRLPTIALLNMLVAPNFFATARRLSSRSMTMRLAGEKNCAVSKPGKPMGPAPVQRASGQESEHGYARRQRDGVKETHAHLLHFHLILPADKSRPAGFRWPVP